MKCICGHEADSYEFMRFEKLRIVGRGDQDDHPLLGAYPTIFGCPKCGTIKVEMRKDYIEE